MRTGALIGYARACAFGQLLDRQQHVLADKLSGKDLSGPSWRPVTADRHQGGLAASGIATGGQLTQHRGMDLR